MDFSKYQNVRKGAGKKVAEIFDRHRKKLPSDRLVQIISEIDHNDHEKDKLKRPDDRAARQPEV